MGDVELLSKHKARRCKEIVGDVVYVLGRLGGAAHIDVLTNAVEAKLRSDRGDGFRYQRLDITAALHAHDLDNNDRVNAALFKRPFGAGSKRWTLHEAAAASQNPVTSFQALD